MRQKRPQRESVPPAIPEGQRIKESAPGDDLARPILTDKDLTPEAIAAEIERVATDPAIMAMVKPVIGRDNDSGAEILASFIEARDDKWKRPQMPKRGRGRYPKPSPMLAAYRANGARWWAAIHRNMVLPASGASARRKIGDQTAEKIQTAIEADQARRPNYKGSRAPMIEAKTGRDQTTIRRAIKRKTNP